MKKGIIDNKLIQYESFFWSPDYLEPSAWMEHIPFAFWIIEVLKPKSLVELGVHNGTSYFSFCQAVKRMNINTVCYGVDTWKGDVHAGFYGEEVFEKVTNHNTKEFSRFSTLIRSTFDEAKEYFIDGSIDLLHIDGLHTYDAVKHDFEVWLPKLSDNSLVIFHDINVREKNFGVFKLWEELTQKYQYFQFDFGHGLGILAIGNSVQEELKELFNKNKNGAYYTFLKNIFSERGNFLETIFNNDLILKQERNDLRALTEVNAQLSESRKTLELHIAQLNESHKALELQNAQLSESHKTLELQNTQLNESHKTLELQNAHLNDSHKTLELHNAQLSESHKILESYNAQHIETNKTLELTNNQLQANLEALELTNRQLQINHKELAASNERLKEQYVTLELAYTQQQEKYQKKLADLLEKLKDTASSFSDISSELSATKKENELFKKYINWYRDTYETRNILGILKDRIKSQLKKKLNLNITPNIRDNISPEQDDMMLNSKKLIIKKNSYYLHPANDIKLTDEDVYISTGADPFFIAEFKDGKVRKGWYFLSIEVVKIKGILLGAKIYYDYGKGFNEDDVWNLPNAFENKIECLIRIDHDLKKFRFDPSSTQCKFQIKKISLRPVSKAKVIATAIKRYKKNYDPGASDFKIYAQLAIGFLRIGESGIGEKVWSSINGKEDHSRSAYSNWCELYDTISENEFDIIKSLSSSLTYQPLFSIIMPVYNLPVCYLKKAIESVENQAYKNWELCIADDSSTNKDVRRLLKEYQSKDKRIKIVFRETNGGISNASNSALELATGNYMVLLDGDDELTPHSLYMVAKAINKNRRLELIYSDEDKIDEQGNRFDPYFKTDWNKDLFYGQNMINHLGVYKLSLIKKIGDFKSDYEGSQDYDLVLRCIEHLKADQIHHIPHVLYHWRAIRGSTAVSVSNKSYVVDAGLRALNDHLKRTGQKATAEQNIHNSYRVKWSVPDQRPMVSIIIPTKDKADVLSTCITSVLEKTSYENFEILIIDNNSKDPLTLEYLKIVQKDHKQIKVYMYKSEFNFSAIVNYGVQQSKGEIIVLLNNDTEVINEDWLCEMVSQCSREEIGAVGAKLYYPNGQIQHAGVFLYEGHPGNHIYLRKDKNDPGYFNKLNLVQNYSVVTAACLAIRKHLYIKVNGFDEKNLKVAYNDVDFCLKIRELGYKNLWTPFAQLVHHESLSRGDDLNGINFIRFKREQGYILAKWKDAISIDPFFNPNLGIDTHTNQFAFPPKVRYEWQDKR